MASPIILDAARLDQALPYHVQVDAGLRVVGHGLRLAGVTGVVRGGILTEGIAPIDPAGAWTGPILESLAVAARPLVGAIEGGLLRGEVIPLADGGFLLGFQPLASGEGMVKRLASLVEHLAQGIVVEDPVRRILLANHALVRLFGLGMSPVKLIGREAEELDQLLANRFADPEPFTTRTLLLISSGRPMRAEIMPLADGRFVERDYVPMQDGGRPSGHLWLYRDITDQVLAERQVRESETNLRALVRALPDTVFTLDAHGIVVDCRVPEGAASFQHPNQFLGRGIESVLPQPIGSQILAIISEVADRGGLTGAQTTLPFILDDHHFNARVSSLPGRQVIVVLTEVTELVQAQRDLAESRRQIRQVVDAVPALLSVKDQQGRFVLCNQAYSDLLRRPGDAIVGRTDEEVGIPRVEADGYRAVDELVRTSRESCVVNETISPPAGGRLWLETHKLPLPQPDGSVHVLAVSTDVTRRVEAESALREAKARLDLVIGNAPIIVWGCDAKGIVTLFEGAGLRAMDLRPGSQIGRNVFSDPVWDDLMRNRIQEAMGGEMQEFDLLYGPSNFRCILYPVFGPMADVSGVVGLAIDQTEQKRVEQDLIQARDRAEEAGRAKSEFLAVMSHELRTPLNGVVGMSQILLNTPISDDQRDAVETIRMCAEQLVSLIGDILDYSKLEAGKMQLERVPLSLATLVEDVVLMVSGKAAAKGLELAWQVDDEVPGRIMGDPTRLRQIFANLAGNAVKFTAQGFIALRVERQGETLRCTVSDSGIGIPEEAKATLFQPFVQVDASMSRRFGGTGLGLAISRKLVENLEGQVGHQDRPGGGSEFWFTLPLGDPTTGDSTISGPMMAHRRIHLQSDGPAASALAARLRGRGAVVTTGDGGAPPAETDLLVVWHRPPTVDARQEAVRHRLPVLALMGPDIPPPGTGPDPLTQVPWPARTNQIVQALSALAARARRGRPRVLVVDENRVQRMVVSRLITLLGMDPQEAGSAAEATRLKGDVDLVLLERMLPDGDGLSVAKSWRKEESRLRRPHLPVVVWCGESEAELERFQVGSGVDAVLTRPLDLDQLTAVIHRLLSVDSP